MSIRLVTLDELTIPCRPDTDKATYSPYGYVVAEDGTLYSLTERWTHGIVLALLYPQQALAAGYEPPVREDGDLDVFRYQGFDLDHGSTFRVIRIAASQLTDSVSVSRGDLPPSLSQVEAVAKAFAAMGLRAKDTLTGETDDLTVAEFLEELRQEARAANQGAQDA